jgi:hypothetical protein
MPLVFVHGVATRKTPTYQTYVGQRDTLFKRLVIGEDDVVFDPDWGSGGVSFFHGGWVPKPGKNEAFALGKMLWSGEASVASALASHDVSQGIDLAFAALLEQRAQESQSLSSEDVAIFEAAVRYLRAGGDKMAFGPNETDAQFAQTLKEELSPQLPAGVVEAMSLNDVFSAIGSAVKRVVDPIRNVASDAVLRVIREPLSDQVALFLGDIFVYLRYREVDGGDATFNRIFAPIIADLARAVTARKDGQKLVVVGHSLGAVILYDLLTNARALQAVNDAAGGRDMLIDALITVGAQPGLFADMGLYGNTTSDKLPRPSCVADWMNVFDYTDVLSFQCEPFFSGVKDYAFDNVSGALKAHSAYFQRPSFYERLQARLGLAQ